MEIIDGRCRPPVKFVMDVLGRPPGLKYFAQRLCALPMPPSAVERSVDLFWKEFEEAGVTKAVFSWRGDTLGGAPPPNFNLTDELAKVVAQNPDKLVGTICVDATRAVHDPIKEIERGVKQYGFKAVGMDVAAGKPKWSFSDERLYPIYQKCVDLDLPIISAVGPLSGPSVDTPNPKFVEAALQTFPRLKLIMSHGPYPFVTEYIALAMRHPNLYLMPDYQTWLPGVSLYLEAANGVLRDQIIFGSAYPIISMKEAVDYYSKYPLTQDAREAVMSKNMKRLLKLA